MAVGGKRDGAGRPKGARNKRTEVQTAAVEQSGLTPLDYMLSVLRDGAQEQDVRMDAAKAAAPYVHARLSAIDASVDAQIRWIVETIDYSNA